jgi:hypothetical protein
MLTTDNTSLLTQRAAFVPCGYLDMQNYLNEHWNKGGAIINYAATLTMNASTLTSNTAAFVSET